MTIILLVSILIIPALWVIGEYKNIRKLRIIAFAISLIALLIIGYAFVSTKIHSIYDREYYYGGLDEIAEMLKNGKTEEAKKAIKTFKKDFESEPLTFW